MLFGHTAGCGNLGLATLLTTRELSLLAGLPTREVPGIPVLEGIDFGLNPAQIPEGESDQIKIGDILHRCQPLTGPGIYLAKSDLSKHVFITGVTGSGKTTTCQKILREAKLPFMVIEPAKTEYRSMLNEFDDLIIFTLGNENTAPFRFNPFELLRGESITSHIDMLKATFVAAFPMEAAMPYMLEDAIYRIYNKYGWDTSGLLTIEKANRFHPDPWDARGIFWPTMDDLLKALAEVVEGEHFDARLENDYKASLISRLKNLTIGAKGQMLNCRLSVDFEKILNSNVIFEMDDLKDSQDKALMMGLILARMNEAIKGRQLREAENGNEGKFQHLTLIEEAHRLLAKAEPGTDDSRRHAVDTFTDMLAEVRKYGEGLIIVDQIPNKLTPEVLKNTNTKIIHKLFAKDDREVVGDSMGLDDDQKKYLSRLRTGEAIIFSGNWPKAAHAKIEQLPNDKAMGISELNKKLKQHGAEWKVNNQQLYFPQLGMLQKQFSTIDELMEYACLRTKVWQSCEVIDKKTAKDDRLFSEKIITIFTSLSLPEYKIIKDDHNRMAECFAIDSLLKNLGWNFEQEEFKKDQAVLNEFFTNIFTANKDGLETWLDATEKMRRLRLTLINR